MKVKIRRAETDDYRAIHQVYDQPLAYSGTLQLPYTSAEVWKKRLENTPEGGCTLVAVVDADIVGSLGLFTAPQVRRRHAGFIGMGVHDQWRGQGVGTALLRAATDLSDNWYNLLRLELTVFVDNEAGIRLYRKQGFEIEGTLEKYAYRNGEYIDAYSMARIRRAGFGTERR